MRLHTHQRRQNMTPTAWWMIRSVSLALSLVLLAWTSLSLWQHAPTDISTIAATKAATSTSSWPGIAVEELGKHLVQKGAVDFIDRARVEVRGQRDYFDEFLEIYSHRPDTVNLCGIRFNHAFALYLTIKAIQPTTIIESGVNAGVSTYIMRRAAPDARIYAIDPLDKPICDQPTRWMDDGNNSVYLTGKENFKDIGEVDWDKLIQDDKIDQDRTLVFLDDHLKVFDRLLKLTKTGFRHVILEDNYATGKGATRADKAGFTPKQMFAKTNDADARYLWHNMVRYAEFPPLVPPSVCKGDHVRKEAGGFLHPTDDGMNVVEPFLRPELDGDDRELYEKVATALGVDVDLVDSESYMQIMNYNHIAYFELVPMSPRLHGEYFK